MTTLKMIMRSSFVFVLGVGCTGCADGLDGGMLRVVFLGIGNCNEECVTTVTERPWYEERGCSLLQPSRVECNFGDDLEACEESRIEIQDLLSDSDASVVCNEDWI